MKTRFDTLKQERTKNLTWPNKNIRIILLLKLLEPSSDFDFLKNFQTFWSLIGSSYRDSLL